MTMSFLLFDTEIFDHRNNDNILHNKLSWSALIFIFTESFYSATKTSAKNLVRRKLLKIF